MFDATAKIPLATGTDIFYSSLKMGNLPRL